MEPIFDATAVRRHRDRAAVHVGRVEPILLDAAQRLLDRLDDVTVPFGHALDVGGRGVVAPLLRARGIATVSLALSSRQARLDGAVAVGGLDFLPFAPASFDLIVASLSLHWVVDLPRALAQLRDVLRPGGLLLASLPAGGTLGELRTALLAAEQRLTGGASPRVAPFVDLRGCAGLLQAQGFAVPVVDGETIELLYADPRDLLRDLRAAGETNAIAARDRRPPPRALFDAALAALPRRDGRAVATLNLAMLTGWAPDERALAPGMAR